MVLIFKKTFNYHSVGHLLLLFVATGIATLVLIFGEMNEAVMFKLGLSVLVFPVSIIMIIQKVLAFKKQPEVISINEKYVTFNNDSISCSFLSEVSIITRDEYYGVYIERDGEALLDTKYNYTLENEIDDLNSQTGLSKLSKDTYSIDLSYLSNH